MMVTISGDQSSPQKSVTKMVKTNRASIWKKRTFFFITVLIICIVLYMEWSLIREQEEQIDRIQRYGEVNIPGWEQTTNLIQISKCVHADRKSTQLVGKNVCPDVPDLLDILLVVCSPIHNYEYRVAIRKTWAKNVYQNYNVNVAFLVGRSEDETVNDMIRNENGQYEDMIVEDFIDNKYNDTLKSVFMLKWTIDNCKKVKFLMKSVDDVYINVHNLSKFIKDPSRIRPNLLVGKLVSNETVSRDSIHKRYMPKYMFNDDIYPDHLSGVGYLMAIETVHLLYGEALHSPYLYLEDVFITGVCTQKAGIETYYDFRFYYIEHGENRVDCSIVYQQKLIIHSQGIDTATIYRDYNEMNNCLERKPAS